MIYINDAISISENEIKEEFVRASGPGGQNVNKVSTAVQLRFDIYNSTSLTEDIKKRLFEIARNRINAKGEVVIDSREYRLQSRNREEALNRLIALIKKAAIKPKKRIQTKLPRSEKEKRLNDKKHRGTIKGMRKKVDLED